MNKGIIISLVCQNPSCEFSEKILVKKTTLAVTKSSGKASFEIPKNCPKCKSELELLSFISGSVEIQPDKNHLEVEE